jgi:hypothetical protein
MLTEFLLANHEFLILGVLFLFGYIVGIYLKSWLEKRIKAPSRGTKKGCEDCVAMQAISERIPKIEGKQEDLRKSDIPQMAENIALLTDQVEDMQENISKLFTLIEQSWLAQINRLETTLYRSMCFPLDGMPSDFKQTLDNFKEKGKRKNDPGRKRTSGTGSGTIQKSKARTKKGGDK